MNEADKSGMSPLKLALCNGSVDMCEILMIAGGSVYSERRGTWIRESVKVDDEEIANLLKFVEGVRKIRLEVLNSRTYEVDTNKNFINLQKLAFYIGQSNIIKMREFIISGADINYRVTPRAPTILHFAVETGNLSVVKTALLSVNKTTLNSIDGNTELTPLFLAVKMNSASLVELL